MGMIFKAVGTELWGQAVGCRDEDGVAIAAMAAEAAGGRGRRDGVAAQ